VSLLLLLQVAELVVMMGHSYLAPAILLQLLLLLLLLVMVMHRT
jgi:hypothetical protein